MLKIKSFTLNFCLLCILSVLVISCDKTNPGTATVVETDESPNEVSPEKWASIKPLPLDPKIEARIDEILPKLSVEQKVAQTIQADSESITPEEVKKYRLGSVLSGGNSAPGNKPYADTKSWLSMADKYFNASIDPEGVEIAIPCIWGIDAVHGHANLEGAIVMPHNVGLGAMHNPGLMEQIWAVTAQELTVSGHDWTFAPTLAVPQDITWGRAYEGFSEDPAVVKSYANHVVDGLQGKFGQDGFMGDGRVISCAKHFLADGATENGVDQGDAQITGKELREVHSAGYYSAIPAGVQTVMASFSSWQGRKLHGDKEILTDVLKGRLGFNGFVVGDWNGHGQVPGCTNTDCAQSINAGVDMFMAPDSWKGLYESTLKHVQEGTITMERLDDAVRRILRVKLASGIFEKGAPSTRANAGDTNVLGLAKNRAVARQAVRESMVLLKNNGGVLPLDAGKTVLVVGDGAKSISKICGGWTLSWQGKGHSNDEFPNGESVYHGIEEAVKAAGGTVHFSESGNTNVKADVVIAVYGEDPYAEFQGDLKNVKFKANGFDVNKLADFKAKGIPVVSVFLSGRPMWVNPEINNSDAFIAAWLPGSEGGGISDLLFQRDPSYDFTGTLSFHWPKTASVYKSKEDRKNNTLFPLEYGLKYGSKDVVDKLSEDDGLGKIAVESTGEFYGKGAPVAPWALWLKSGSLDKQIGSFPTSVGGLIVSKTDHKAQEDALKIKWTETNYDQILLSAVNPSDMSRESNGAILMTFMAKSFTGKAGTVKVGINDKTIDVNIAPGAWKEYRISLSCYDKLGVDMTKIKSALVLSAGKGVEIGLSDVILKPDTGAAKLGCDGK